MMNVLPFIPASRNDSTINDSTHLACRSLGEGKSLRRVQAHCPV